jgi:Integrase zinc binding domain/Integrase core domain
MSEILRKGTDTEIKILKIPKSKEEYKKFASIEKKALEYARANNRVVVYYEYNNTLYIFLPNTDVPDDLRSPVQALGELCTRIGLKNLSVAKNEDNRKLIKELKRAEKYLKEKDMRISLFPGVERIEDLKTRKIILNDFHTLITGGHAGVNRMLKNIQKYYFWPGMSNDVTNYVKVCESCQRYKHSLLPKEEMVITTTATEALDKIFLDLVGPITSDDEYKYILTMQCELSKYIVAAPLTDKETATVARAFVQNFILRYGIPSVIATDCGTEFMSEVFTQVCKLLKITKLNSTAYHHESIGALENSHKHLGAFLRAQISAHGGSWFNWINYWTFSYNNTVHTETKYSPFELVFGRNSNLPSNLLRGLTLDPVYNPDNYAIELKYRLQTAAKDARENLIASKEHRKSFEDRTKRPVTIAVGDKVMVRKENRQGKLDDIFNGPFEVTAINEPNVELKIKNNKTQTIHKNRLKIFHK